MSELGASTPEKSRLRAGHLIELGRYDEALAILYRALASDPHDIQSMQLAAQAQLARSDFEEAATLAERAAAAAPDEEWTWRLLARASSGQGDDERAVQAAERAVALAPGEWRGRVTLARVAVKDKERRNLALESAQRAIALEPNEPGTHLALAHVWLAYGRPLDAEASVMAALELDPDSSAARNDLGRVRLALGDLSAGAEDFAAALRAAPRDRTMMANLRAAAVTVVVLCQISVAILLALTAILVIWQPTFPPALSAVVPAVWIVLFVLFRQLVRQLLGSASTRVLRRTIWRDRTVRTALALTGVSLVACVASWALPLGVLWALIWAVAVGLLAAAAWLCLRRRGPLAA